MTNKIKRDPEPPRADVTDLLLRWQSGDPAAFERLIPLVYRELRQLAHNYLRQERGNHTLQSTARKCRVAHIFSRSRPA
jgi:hypothetical protein